jgi:hypothetical protein
VFGTAVAIRKVLLVVLFMKVMSNLLDVTFLAVIMLRFQYSLKLSFSSPVADVYL